MPDYVVYTLHVYATGMYWSGCYPTAASRSPPTRICMWRPVISSSTVPNGHLWKSRPPRGVVCVVCNRVYINEFNSFGI